MKPILEKQLEKILLHLNKQDHRTFTQQYEKHMFVMFWIDMAICAGMFGVILFFVWLAHFI